MSKPTAKINRTIRSEQVLETFVAVVRKNLRLELKNTRITSEDMIYVLAYALSFIAFSNVRISSFEGMSLGSWP